ncbi:MAG: hypothetical protein ABSG43_19940 [Solirubrobacteraceae bacterium]
MLAHDQLGALQLARDFGIATSLQHPRAKGKTLPFGKPIHERERVRASARELVDPGEVGIVEHLGCQRQTAPRPVLDAPATAALTQLVLSDPAHPGNGRTSTPRPEASRDQENRREHLGREIRGRLSITRLMNEIRDHGGKVATVKRRERRTIPRGNGREQLAIRSLLIHCHLKH